MVENVPAIIKTLETLFTKYDITALSEEGILSAGNTPQHTHSGTIPFYSAFEPHQEPGVLSFGTF